MAVEFKRCKDGGHEVNEPKGIDDLAAFMTRVSSLNSGDGASHPRVSSPGSEHVIGLVTRENHYPSTSFS